MGGPRLFDRPRELPKSEPLRPELARGALSAVIDARVLPHPQIAVVLATLQGIEWGQGAKTAVYIAYVTNPERTEEEAAFGEYMLGTPHSSDEESSADEEKPPFQSAQSLREQNRQGFFRWWARQGFLRRAPPPGDGLRGAPRCH